MSSTPGRFTRRVTALAVVAAAVLAVAGAPAAGAAARKPGKPVAAPPAPVPSSLVAGPGTRAMWVWDTSTPEATVDVAVAAGVGQLFVAVPPNVTSSSRLGEIRTLAERARAAGMRVDALGGDPGWVDNPSWVLTSWLTPAKNTGLFTGIHVDVEPYSTSAWSTNRAAVVSKYLTLLDQLRTSAGAFPVEADIPFWFDTVPATGPGGAASSLDREIMRRTAGVTVMAYRNRATGTDSTLSVAAPALAAGAALGKPVRLGQETTYLGPTAVDAKQTFHGFTRTAMEVQLAQVVAGASSSATFAGLSIHSAAGYAAMAP